MVNSKIDSDCLNYWKFLLKLVIPIVLLSCKAKVMQEQKCIDTVVFDCKKDTSNYHFSDEFTDAQLRQLCREGKLVINNK
jgi:hypothetical protein